MKVNIQIRNDESGYIYEVLAFFNDDLVGSILLGKLSKDFDGQYIKYAKVISEANYGQGIGTQMYDALLKYCRNNKIRLFRQKHPTIGALKVWQKLEPFGITYKERPDLMSTHHELEVILENYSGL